MSDKSIIVEVPKEEVQLLQLAIAQTEGLHSCKFKVTRIDKPESSIFDITLISSNSNVVFFMLGKYHAMYKEAIKKIHQ